MTDALSAKSYAILKEAMATGAFPAESGASQIAEVIVAQSGGRLDARDAERVSAMRAMGKANNLFRNGKNPAERKTAVAFLWRMVKREETREGRPRWRFSKTTCVCVSTVAVDETCWDACPTCQGAGVVPMGFSEQKIDGRQPMTTCHTCMGSRKRKYDTEERVAALAKAWAGIMGVDDADGSIAREIRADKRLRGFIDAIEWGRGKLLEAERMAVEGAAEMLERWT